LLCEASLYFRTLFKGAFSEQDAKEFAVLDVPTRTISMFQNWLYSGQILFLGDTNIRELCQQKEECRRYSPPVKEPIEDRHNEPFHWSHDLFTLFRFGDVYEVPLLQREVMITWQHLQDTEAATISARGAVEIWNGIPPNSSLARYLVIITAIQYSISGIESFFDADVDLPATFVKDLLLAVSNLPVIVDMSWCDFHEHKSDAEMIACRSHRFEEGRYSELEYWAPKSDS
jgi:hypothetical protein